MLLTGRFISDEYPNIKGTLSVSCPITLSKISPKGVLCEVTLECPGLFYKEATIRLFKDKGMLSGSNIEKDTQSFILSLTQVGSSSDVNRFLAPNFWLRPEIRVDLDGSKAHQYQPPRKLFDSTSRR